MAIADIVAKFRSRFVTYTPVVHLLEDSASALPTNQKGTSNAAHVLEAGVVGGERNTSSPTNNYDATKHEANRSTLVAGTAAQNIGTGGTTPIYFMGVIVHTALAGTLTIVGFTDTAGAAASVVLPIGFVGAWGVGNAARCETGCTVTKSSAVDDGRIVIDWRPLG